MTIQEWFDSKPKSIQWLIFGSMMTYLLLHFSLGFDMIFNALYVFFINPHLLVPVITTFDPITMQLYIGIRLFIVFGISFTILYYMIMILDEELLKC